MSWFFKRATAKPPVMTLEGVLGPNSRLDEARSISVDRPDAIAIDAAGRLAFSSGASVFALDRFDDAPRLVHAFDETVTALAASPDGRLAIGLATGRMHVLDPAGKARPGDFHANAEAGPVVDCLFGDGEEIITLQSGYPSADAALSMAPWEPARRGVLAAHLPDGGVRRLAGELHCPMGVTRDRAGDLVITELDAARVVDAQGRVRRAGFPAYMGRIRKVDGGFALACLSRRDPLIEFLRTERRFVDEMKTKIDPRHWISPRANPEFSADFPIELGATRLFGEIKPWAPSFSYGLIILLDEDFMPIGSAQSRANGRRHAISNALVWNGELIAVSQASGEILNLGSVT
jgi:hypothetical protein